MSKQSLWQRWKKTSLPNKLMVISTGIMAVATICLVIAGILQYLAAREQLQAVREQANIMRGQLESMNSSSKQTQDLIAATQQTASASQSVAEQNKELIKHAGEQANAATTQANASQTQAKASVAQAGIAEQALGATQSSARATEQSVQISREALRPIVGVTVEIKTIDDTEISYAVVIRNEGGTAANITLRYCALDIKAPSPLPTVDACNPAQVRGPFTVLPHRDFPTVVRIKDVGTIRQRKIYLLAVGEVTYLDFTGKRSVPFCYVYREDFKGMGECGDLQNPENQNKPN